MTIRVLIADDHAIVKEGLVQLLTDHDFEVVGAVADGTQLLEAATRLRPDVIVTDLLLPRHDGWTLISELKADPRTAAIPIIVLTGHVAPAHPARARAAGCAAFLMKPCLPVELLNTVQRVLKMKRQSRQ